jgi:hypothetical protein
MSMKERINPMLGTSPEARALQAKHAREIKARRRRERELEEARMAGKPRPPRAP